MAQDSSGPMKFKCLVLPMYIVLILKIEIF